MGGVVLTNSVLLLISAKRISRIFNEFRSAKYTEGKGGTGERGLLLLVVALLLSCYYRRRSVNVLSFVPMTVYMQRTSTSPLILPSPYDLIANSLPPHPLQPVSPLPCPGHIMSRFYEFDTDRSGCLNRAELAALCQSLGASLSKHELEVALFVLDDDADGKIKAIEFLRWWKSSQFNIVDAYL